MRRLLTCAAAVLAVAFLSGVAASPASAAGTSASANVRMESVPGLGEFPVTCEATTSAMAGGALGSSNVFTTTECTANDQALRGERVCVSKAGTALASTVWTTLCSDYGPMVAAMEAAKAADEARDTDPDKLNFSCEPLDFWCLGTESVSRDVARWVTDSVEWVFDQSAFSTESSLWQVSVDEAGFWWGVAVFIVMGAVAVGIAWSALTGSGQGMRRAILGLLFTFAATWVSIMSLGYVLDAVDGLSAAILEHGMRDGSIPAMVRNLMFPDGIDAVMKAVNPTSTMFSLMALAGGMGVAAFVNSLRNFGLMVLISFAPLAFALMPVGAGKTWIRNWVSAVVALLLTKPLMLGLLVLVMSGMGQIDSLYSIQAFPLYIGLFMTLFMPFVAFGLFSFIGAHGAQAFDSAGRGAGRAAQSVGRSVSGGIRRVGAPRKSAGGRGSGSQRNGGGQSSPKSRGDSSGSKTAAKPAPATPAGPAAAGERTPATRPAPQPKPASPAKPGAVGAGAFGPQNPGGGKS